MLIDELVRLLTIFTLVGVHSGSFGTAVGAQTAAQVARCSRHNTAVCSGLVGATAILSYAPQRDYHSELGALLPGTKALRDFT